MHWVPTDSSPMSGMAWIGAVWCAILWRIQEIVFNTSWTLTNKAKLNNKCDGLVCVLLVARSDVSLSTNQWTVLCDASITVKLSCGLNGDWCGCMAHFYAGNKQNTVPTEPTR